MKENILPTIKTYNPKAVCEKCDGTDISSRYGKNKKDQSEYIERECSRCNFRWDELPVNNSNRNGQHDE